MVARNPETEDPDRDNDVIAYRQDKESIFDFTERDPFSEGEY